jgi:cellulose synthase/poly-beta-1,6-N-acetylglucosamine synthase-like glycosyltransferase
MMAFFIVFCSSAGIQLFYYLWFYLAPAIFIQPKKSNVTPPVTVIICARNEASNLENFLPSVLEQDYPEFEVIVVNDCSEDRTDDVLGKLLIKYPNLHISSITKDPKFTHNKKFAQFIGIKAAEHDILLFTDADCKPESSKWISQMVSDFSSDTEFVLGYGGFSAEKGLLNRYIRYDCMFIAMQYLGMAIRGIPYMGVGRNLAYRKEVFFRNRGFGNHNHVVSGDDDLFVNTNASRANTAVEFCHEAHTRSIPAATTGEWVKQKHRHLTTAKYYRLRDRFLLILEPFSRILFYALFIILVSSLYLWPFVLGIFGIRMIAQIIVFELMRRKLNEKGVLFISVFFDIFSPLINTALYIGTFRVSESKAKWK